MVTLNKPYHYPHVIFGLASCLSIKLKSESNMNARREGANESVTSENHLKTIMFSFLGGKLHFQIKPCRRLYHILGSYMIWIKKLISNHVDVLFYF